MIENWSLKPPTPIKNSELKVTRILRLVSHLHPRQKLRKLGVINLQIEIACAVKITSSTDHYFCSRCRSCRDPLLCFTDSLTCYEKFSNECLLVT
jgi:hypothetical protein